MPVILVLTCINYISIQFGIIQFGFFLVWWVIFYWKLDIFILRCETQDIILKYFWLYFPDTAPAGEVGALPYYYQMGAGVPHSASTDTCALRACQCWAGVGVPVPHVVSTDIVVEAGSLPPGSSASPDIPLILIWHPCIMRGAS